MATIPNNQNPRYHPGGSDSIQEHARRMRNFRQSHGSNPGTGAGRGGSFAKHVGGMGIFRRLHSYVLGRAPRGELSLAKFIPVPPRAQTAMDRGGSRHPVGAREWSLLIPMWNSGRPRFSPN